VLSNTSVVYNSSFPTFRNQALKQPEKYARGCGCAHVEEELANSSERLVRCAWVPRLANCEGDVAVFDHVLDLSSHWDC
jgi:hypothetical protein